jgi:CheY-like chemotaxis protein
MKRKKTKHQMAADSSITTKKLMERKARVLIADDDESIRDIFSLILSGSKYSLDLHTDGQDILRGKFVIPDIFLLDKQMPGVGGLDLCRHLKNDPATKNIPVIIASASPDISRIYAEAGADGYLEKPFEISRLKKVISDFVNKSKNSSAADPAAKPRGTRK